MEFNAIAKYLQNKCILITGSTGYLGKLFVEKVLRLQPEVGKLFLLVRAIDQSSAKKRIETEVLQSQLFQILREKYRENFIPWFWDKVHAVAGDVSFENLGLSDGRFREHLWNEVDIVINIAAVTRFKERYDVALSINTFGVKRVMEFALRCVKLEMLLHISTAYVTKATGIILEKPLDLHKALDGHPNLDILEEMALVRAKLKELKCSKASEHSMTLSMKELGIQRSRTFGWPSVYSFTKAMGEILAYDQCGRLPLVILRPTAITSTWKEPFPGWIEGIKTVDHWIIGYGKGDLKWIPGDVTVVIDLVPADIVVNAMLAIVAAHPRGTPDFIYHVGSSVRNPCTFGELMYLAYKYFSEKPCIGMDGRRVEVKEPNLPATMASFYTHMNREYREPLQVLEQHGGASTIDDQSRYSRLKREYHQTVAVAEAFRTAAFFKRRFDDSNMQKLMTSIKKKDRELIPFDTKCINWEQYLMEVHIPGALKHGTREKTRPRL